jgi:hypothetical protein
MVQCPHSDGTVEGIYLPRILIILTMWMTNWGYLWRHASDLHNMLLRTSPMIFYAPAASESFVLQQEGTSRVMQIECYVENGFIIALTHNHTSFSRKATARASLALLDFN